MASGPEPGCCFHGQFWIDQVPSQGHPEGRAYAAANTIKICLGSSMTGVFRLCTGSGCRDLRNVGHVRSSSGGSMATGGQGEALLCAGCKIGMRAA